MAFSLLKLLKLTPPPRRETQGTAYTPTYRPMTGSAYQPIPLYRDHQYDLADQRQALDAKRLMEFLFRSDPDVSAAVNAYLTVADTTPLVHIKDLSGEYRPDLYPIWNQLLVRLFHEMDLTKGFNGKASFRALCENLRYMCLLRGGCAGELVCDANTIPQDVRLVDPGNIRWSEPEPGHYLPTQYLNGNPVPISLDIPTFFQATYRGSPTTNYPYPPFIAAINTIAARQQIINDLYRIMTMTGYPRLDVTVMEEVITNSAPTTVKTDPTALRKWTNDRINEIRGVFANVTVDQAFVHTDATVVKIVNEKNPGMGIDVNSVIEVLNAQNTAGLKSVATILGRGNSGVNTASIEARIFAMNADELNAPVADMLSKMFSVALQILGYPVMVTVEFRPAEMRPTTELEPMMIIRQARLLETLSLGLTTDDEFHMTMYGRLPPKGAPKLMGTGFFQAEKDPVVDAGEVSPNADPLGRALAPKGGKAAGSNATRNTKGK